MAADYPTSVKSFSTKVDNVDLVMAADVNDLQVEVAAIETQLVTSKLATLTSAPAANKVLTTDGSGNPSWAAKTDFVPSTQFSSTDGTWLDYTPTWTATTTDPTLPGSLTGRYAQVGKMVTVQIYLSCGPSTTYGSGSYAFSLPVAASDGASYAWGIARARIASLNYTFSVIVNPSATAITGFLGITNGTNENAITPTVPATWQNGSTLGLQITYEVA